MKSTMNLEEHKAMKRWARRHLQQKGIPVVRGEVSKLGYEIDVGSLDHTTFIECGDTEPKKVLDLMRNGLQIGILQYRAEEIAWFIPSKDMVTQLEDNLGVFS